MSGVPETPYECDWVWDCNRGLPDDDDDLYGDGLHEMTEEESNRYWKQVSESDGFDVEYFPDVYAFGLIMPVSIDHDREYLEKLINFAIGYHNKNSNGKKLRLKDPLKWNLQAMCPMDYYITFTAEDEETGELNTYQAKVVTRCPVEDNMDVDIFRVKPNIKRASEGSPPGGSSSKKICS